MPTPETPQGQPALWGPLPHRGTGLDLPGSLFSFAGAWPGTRGVWGALLQPPPGVCVCAWQTGRRPGGVARGLCDVCRRRASLRITAHDAGYDCRRGCAFASAGPAARVRSVFGLAVSPCWTSASVCRSRGLPLQRPFPRPLFKWGGGGFRWSQRQLQWRPQVTHKAVGGSYRRLEGRLQVVGGQAKA